MNIFLIWVYFKVKKFNFIKIDKDHKVGCILNFEIFSLKNNFNLLKLIIYLKKF